MWKNGIDLQRLEPKVTASCHSDDHVVEVKAFDATPWFAQADVEDLRALLEEGFCCGYTADEVAECMSDCDPCVQAMFAHNEALPADIDLRGFACYIDEKQARAWLQRHCPHVLLEEAGNTKGGTAEPIS